MLPPADSGIKEADSLRLAEKDVRKKQVITRPKVDERDVSRRPLVDSYELPTYYGVTRLTLMVKDPLWIYAYWDIAPDALESLKARLSVQEFENAKTILRMYDVTLVDFNGSNANSYFDIEVGPYTNNWYINLWHDDVSYVGEVGLRISDGRFFALVRSNCVHTPRMSYSPRTEQMWLKVVDGRTHKPPYIMSRRIKTYQLDRKLLTDREPPREKKRAIYLTEEEIRRYYSKLSPMLRHILASRISKLYKKQDDRQVGGYAFILEGESEEERQAVLSMLPRDYFIRRVLLGSSEEFVLGASEQLLKGPGGASGFIEEKIKQRKFFFELSTELIVYGRTEPDAEVWLGDKKIQLRKDGTFSLRFALPDGKIPLGFTAVSSDKEEIRKINTSIERNTHYVD